MSNLFFNKLLFVMEIWIAVFLYTLRLRKAKHFWLRLIGCVALLCGLVMAINYPTDNAWVLSFTYLGIFLIVLLSMKFCFEEPWQNIVFCGVAAYTTQHLAYQMANLVLTSILNNISPLLSLYGSETFDTTQIHWIRFYIAVYLLCYYVVYCITFFVFGNKIQSGSQMSIKSFKMLLLVSTGLVIDILLNSIFLYSDILKVGAKDVTLFTLMVYVYNCLCCILLLIVQFGLVLRRKLEDELSMIKQLWRLRTEQYEVAKENISIINQKCHDMKHQIHEIGHVNRISKDVVEEIEHSIQVYDAMVKTGNDVLDIIFTEKRLHCVANKIALSCMADGAKISFIKDSDLYALFGNAMDNAIEAVKQIKEEERRVISLILRESNNFIAVSIDNTFDGEIEFVDGLPMTKKMDTNVHGFGMKSMRMIVERYNGEMEVTINDDIFSLNILIPIPNQEKSTRN